MIKNKIKIFFIVSFTILFFIIFSLTLLNQSDTLSVDNKNSFLPSSKTTTSSSLLSYFSSFIFLKSLSSSIISRLNSYLFSSSTSYRTIPYSIKAYTSDYLTEEDYEHYKNIINLLDPETVVNYYPASSLFFNKTLSNNLKLLNKNEKYNQILSLLENNDEEDIIKLSTEWKIPSNEDIEKVRAIEEKNLPNFILENYPEYSTIARSFTFFLLGDWGKGGISGAYSTEIDLNTQNDQININAKIDTQNNNNKNGNNQNAVASAMSYFVSSAFSLDSLIEFNYIEDKKGLSYQEYVESKFELDHHYDENELQSNTKINIQNNVNENAYVNENKNNNNNNNNIKNTLHGVPSFVIALGDNFYNNGVTGYSDYMWEYVWKAVYHGSYRNLYDLTWYPVLGNHDYGTSNNNKNKNSLSIGVQEEEEKRLRTIKKNSKNNVFNNPHDLKFTYKNGYRRRLIEERGEIEIKDDNRDNNRNNNNDKNKYNDDYDGSFVDIDWANNDFTNAKYQTDRYYNLDDDLWVFPARNYTSFHSIPFTKNGGVAIVYIDTTTLAPSVNKCCNENGYVYFILFFLILINCIYFLIFNFSGISKGEQKKRIVNQLFYIEKYLYEAIQTKPSWLIVAGHYPVFSAGDQGDTSELYYYLLPLLEKYNVHAYVCGHDHISEHLQGSYGSNGVQYFVSGAGAMTDGLKGNTNGKLVWSGTGYSAFSAIQANSSHLITNFIDTSGNIVYQYTQTNPLFFNGEKMFSDPYNLYVDDNIKSAEDKKNVDVESYQYIGLSLSSFGIFIFIMIALFIRWSNKSYTKNIKDNNLKNKAPSNITPHKTLSTDSDDENNFDTENNYLGKKLLFEIDPELGVNKTKNSVFFNTSKKNLSICTSSTSVTTCDDTTSRGSPDYSIIESKSKFNKLSSNAGKEKKLNGLNFYSLNNGDDSNEDCSENEYYNDNDTESETDPTKKVNYKNEENNKYLPNKFESNSAIELNNNSMKQKTYSLSNIAEEFNKLNGPENKEYQPRQLDKNHFNTKSIESLIYNYDSDESSKNSFSTKSYYSNRNSSKKIKSIKSSSTSTNILTHLFYKVKLNSALFSLKKRKDLSNQNNSMKFVELKIKSSKSSKFTNSSSSFKHNSYNYYDDLSTIYSKDTKKDTNRNEIHHYEFKSTNSHSKYIGLSDLKSLSEKNYNNYNNSTNYSYNDNNIDHQFDSNMSQCNYRSNNSTNTSYFSNKIKQSDNYELKYINKNKSNRTIPLTYMQTNSVSNSTSNSSDNTVISHFSTTKQVEKSINIVNEIDKSNNNSNNLAENIKHLITGLSQKISTASQNYYNSSSVSNSSSSPKKSLNSNSFSSTIPLVPISNNNQEDNSNESIKISIEMPNNTESNKEVEYLYPV